MFACEMCTNFLCLSLDCPPRKTALGKECCMYTTHPKSNMSFLVSVDGVVYAVALSRAVTEALRDACLLWCHSATPQHAETSATCTVVGPFHTMVAYTDAYHLGQLT